ncbi:hypothetical protein PTKIN_Ptkin10aG0043100 [Pterospermum kingtungense]
MQSWFQSALNDSWGCSSVENGWNSGGDPLFLSSASMYGKGVISLGFPVKILTDIFTGIDVQGGNLSLTTKDGKFLVDGIPNSKLISANNSIYLHLMNQKVYALALPHHEGLVSLVHNNRKLSLILLAATVLMVAISSLIFVVLMSLALAGASHDIRSSLAGITGLIDLCLADAAAPSSGFEAYLKQMHNCAQDLLGLLNSILDTSKIEAGMMKLEEEEFNLAELLEHVVHLYHPVAHNDNEAINAVRQSPKSMEILFEMDDTGKGIPKEKQKSVFENFVQVKETAAGQVGTGLGLGIVQSLVRLMGGEIGIIDKDIGERTPSISNPKGEKESKGNAMSGNTHHYPGLNIHGPSFTIRTSSPKLSIIPTPSPNLKGSQVVLLKQYEERGRIAQKLMESHGINVLVVDRWECLPSALKKIKLKQISSSRRSDLSSRSDISRSESSKDMPISAIDRKEQILPSKCRGSPSAVLVIDVNAGPFS